VSQVRAVAGRREPVLAVPFVGDVAGLGVALAINQGDLDREVTVLYGAPSAPVTSWARQEGTRLSSPVLPVLSAAVDDGTGLVHMVALTPANDSIRVAWSPTAVMDADAFLRRRYTEFALDHGVGTAAARGDVASFALRASTSQRIVITPFTVTVAPGTPRPVSDTS
jgi:hypothetical protein